MQTKVCSGCKIEKDINEFNKNKTRKDGYHHYCKTCSKEFERIYLLNPINRKKKNIISLQSYYLNIEQSMIKDYKRSDKKKNRICDLTIEWVKENITSKKCIYCGDTKNIGCDRIDNNKGHTKDNVQPCCKNCNYIRNTYFSVEEMKLIGLLKSQFDKNNKAEIINNFDSVFLPIMQNHLAQQAVQNVHV